MFRVHIKENTDPSKIHLIFFDIYSSNWWQRCIFHAQLDRCSLLFKIGKRIDLTLPIWRFFFIFIFFSVHVLPFSKIFKQLQLLLPLLGRCPEFRYSCNNVHPRFWYYWLLAYKKLDMVFSFFLYISFWFDGNIFFLVMAWIYFLDISNKTSTSWIKMPSCRSYSKWILKWDLLFT